eukprot:GHVS01098127.1.p1 GENE.GHVS01098127.1~~GHVS01098127.1.p1  ORF type:complete len:138 (-),score=11.33 GHVS01098127.1:28-441(-)
MAKATKRENTRQETTSIHVFYYHPFWMYYKDRLQQYKLNYKHNQSTQCPAIKANPRRLRRCRWVPPLPGPQSPLPPVSRSVSVSNSVSICLSMSPRVPLSVSRSPVSVSNSDARVRVHWPVPPLWLPLHVPPRWLPV